jgi:hypothetical protein
MSDAERLKRFLPYLQYDSFESFRADSAATMPEQFFDDGSEWSYSNSLKREGGAILAVARPEQGQTQLDLAFLGPRKYANGDAVRRTDHLDAVGRRYVADAQRMHADPRYADRVYGRAAREQSGAIWLQYWFFYYHNDKSFFGAGVHEGDWEMIQLRLGPDGQPTAATFAQHSEGEPFAWSDLELRDSADGQVPVVYVGRGSHASFAHKGEHWPMFPLPPDYANGEGPSVRPALEVITDDGPAWVLWPGKWGSSDSSPRGPADKQQWRDPAGFHREVGGSPVRGRRARPRVRLAPALPVPPAPTLKARRVEDRALVEYRFPKKLGPETARPEKIVVSLDSPDDDLPPASHTFTVSDRTGVVTHPTRLGDRRYIVRVLAYSDEGVQSRVVSARLPRATG